MDLTCAANSLTTSFGDGVNPYSFLDPATSSNTYKLGAVLLSLLGSLGEVSSVISNVSVIQTWKWFFHLSAFESVLLFFVIAKICILEIIGILPINLSEFWTGNAAGRRKRRQLQPSVQPHVAQTAAKLLILYKKLDKNECGFRALCELEKVTHDNVNYEEQHLPQATFSVLRKLRSYAANPVQTKSNNKFVSDELENNGRENGVDMRAALGPYAEAVKIGSEYGKSPNHGCNYLFKNSSTCKPPVNICERKYSTCPVTSDEVLAYIEQVNLLLQEL